MKIYKFVYVNVIFYMNFEVHKANNIRVPPSVIKNVAYVFLFYITISLDSIIFFVSTFIYLIVIMISINISNNYRYFLLYI